MRRPPGETCVDAAEAAFSWSCVWWLSFVVDGTFAGVIVADGQTAADAIRATHQAGCNPGGEIRYVAIPPAAMKELGLPRLVLLSRSDLQAAGVID